MHYSINYHYYGSYLIIPPIIIHMWVVLDGTPSNINEYIIKNLCTKIGAFVCLVTIISLSHLTATVCMCSLTHCNSVRVNIQTVDCVSSILLVSGSSPFNGFIICSDRPQGLRGSDHTMLMMHHLLRRVSRRDPECHLLSPHHLSLPTLQAKAYVTVCYHLIDKATVMATLWLFCVCRAGYQQLWERIITILACVPLVVAFIWTCKNMMLFNYLRNCLLLQLILLT